MTGEISELERLADELQAKGLQWIEAKLKSDQLDADEKSFLAAIMNELEKSFDGVRQLKVSEAKLERLARGSTEFRNYIVGRVTAQAETGRKKVLYEAAQNYWEAKRSEMAFEREKLSKGVYHTGR